MGEKEGLVRTILHLERQKDRLKRYRMLPDTPEQRALLERFKAPDHV